MNKRVVLLFILYCLYISCCTCAERNCREYDIIQTNCLESLPFSNYKTLRHTILEALTKGADPNVLIRMKGCNSSSILHIASTKNDLELVMIALQKGARPVALAPYNTSPLWETTSADIAQHLICYNADVHEVDNDNNNLLHAWMNVENSAPLVALWCNAGVNPNHQERWQKATPLCRLFSGYIPKDYKIKTAILLMADADIDFLTKSNEKHSLAYNNFINLIDVCALQASVPRVKQERKNNREQTKAFLTSMITRHPADIIDQYIFEPVWDDTCLSLFEKYSRTATGQGIQFTQVK